MAAPAPSPRTRSVTAFVNAVRLPQLPALLSHARCLPPVAGTKQTRPHAILLRGGMADLDYSAQTIPPAETMSVLLHPPCRSLYYLEGTAHMHTLPRPRSQVSLRVHVLPSPFHTPQPVRRARRRNPKRMARAMRSYRASRAL